MPLNQKCMFASQAVETKKKNKVFSRQLSSPFPPQSNTAKGEGGETSILQTTDFCSLPAFEGMMPGGI